MPATLYGHPVSQPARSCQWFIDFAKKKDDVEVKYIDVLGGEHKKPEYVAKFPNHQVPSFETEDGLCFAESLAILLHLARDDERFTPAGAKDAARLNEYFGRHFSNVRKMSTELFRHIAFTKDEEKIAAGYETVKPQLEAFDARLGKQQYVLGDRLTLADFLFAPEVDQLRFALEGKFLKPHPNIVAYLDRLAEQVPGYKQQYETCVNAMKQLAEKLQQQQQQQQK